VGSIFNRGRFEMADRIILACSQCKQRNYTTTKNKRTMRNRLELKKYCRFCRTHTLHKETK
jgi:large subunit ribosomal protein L33